MVKALGVRCQDIRRKFFRHIWRKLLDLRRKDEVLGLERSVFAVRRKV